MTTAIGSVKPASLDLAGVLVSALCIAHCLAGPIAAGVLATAGIVLWDERPTHLVLTTVILLVAIVALVPAWRRHRRVLPLILAAVGVAALIAAVTVGEAISHDAEPVLTVLGGLAMITAHVLNQRLGRSVGPTAGKVLVSVSHTSVKEGAR